MLSKTRNALVAIAILLVPSLAHAGFLVLAGGPTIRATHENGSIRLTGTFPLANQGNELAVNVYPAISVGSFSWAGEAKSLAAGESHEWTIDALVDISEIGCAKDALCAGQKLPVSGAVPLLARIHYQDINNYPFSASQAHRLMVGDRGNTAPSDSIQGKLMLSGNGQYFDGWLSVQNSSPNPKRVSVSFFSSREILVKTVPFILEVPAQSVANGTVELENFKGLPGSTYPIYAVLQSEENGERVVEIIYDNITLARPNNRLPIVVGVVVVLSLGLLALWFVVSRRRAQQ